MLSLLSFIEKKAEVKKLYFYSEASISASYYTLINANKKLFERYVL